MGFYFVYIVFFVYNKGVVVEGQVVDYFKKFFVWVYLDFYVFVYVYSVVFNGCGKGCINFQYCQNYYCGKYFFYVIIEYKLKN